jgi:DnaJ-class molecular chaperone
MKKKIVKEDKRKVCPLCNGSGLDINDSEKPCPKCNGSGRE